MVHTHYQQIRVYDEDMRTNIVIDDELMDAALRCSEFGTKRGVVEQALREFVASREQRTRLEAAAGAFPDFDIEAFELSRGHSIESTERPTS